MARITVEDCLERVTNRFELIHMAAKRVRGFRKGEEPLVRSKNTDPVIALREIAAGLITAKKPIHEEIAELRMEEAAQALPEVVDKP